MSGAVPTPPPLEPGLGLGPYRLIQQIGAGGMGVIWKAQDPALGREVALKFLPEALVGDPERLARFQREARVLAALSHPNIAAVFGLHQESGHRFLAMELAPGEDLSRRLARGPMPGDEALEAARQVAEGMEAAHDSGVVHRDLKPGNIMVAPDGRVRILDFGLARAVEGDPATPDASLSPTLTTPATRTGVVLGTAMYMSPEQARGRPVDRRADIWAFGCVLYEMLCGRKAFSGETVSDILAAVLRAEPDWRPLPASTPPAVRLLLARCLEKDARRRLRDIGEARVALEGASEGGAPGAAPALPGAPGAPLPAAPGTGRALVLGLGILAAVAVAFLAGNSLRPRPSAPDVVRFTIPLEADMPPSARAGGLGFSPDGRTLAYIDGPIHLRALDEERPRVLAGTERARHLAWSPDGEWIAYTSGRRLLKIDPQGGEPILVGSLPRELSQAGGICWLADGRIIVTTGGSGLLQVPSRGGGLESFLAPSGEEDDLHNCAALPGGSGILTIPHLKSGETILTVVTSEVRRALVTERMGGLQGPAWSPSGHILFGRGLANPGLWALPFSVRSMEPEADPLPVSPQGFTPAASSRGALAYITSDSWDTQEIAVVDREGRKLRTIGRPAAYVDSVHLSPDESRLAVTVRTGGGDDVWIHDLRRGTRSRVTSDAESARVAGWAPDGQRLLLAGQMEEGLYLVHADGAGGREKIGPGDQGSFTPDGRTLVYAVPDAGNRYDIWSIDLREGGEPEPLIRTEASEAWPQVSPGGDFLAYQTNAAGRVQTMLRPFPEGEGRWQVSGEEGFWPRWSARGDRIYYLGDGRLWETEVRTGPEVELGTPRPLLEAEDQAPYFVFDWPMPFEVMGQGDETRFLLTRIVRTDESEADRITVILNWAEGIQAQE